MVIEMLTERPAIKPFWSTVAGGVIATVASTVILATAGEINALWNRATVPAGAIILVNGPCPSGWHRYEERNLPTLELTFCQRR